MWDQALHTGTSFGGKAGQGTSAMLAVRGRAALLRGPRTGDAGCFQGGAVTVLSSGFSFSLAEHFARAHCKLVGPSCPGPAQSPLPGEVKSHLDREHQDNAGRRQEN